MAIFQTQLRILGRRSLLGVLALLATLSAGHLATTAQNSGSPKVVATFLPMYMFTKGVIGSTGNVEVLVPPNAEVHGYQASPGNVRTLSQSGVLVKNGLGMEEFLERLIANAGNSQLKQIDASQGITAIESDHHDHEGHDDHGDHHDHGAEHHHEEGNPHVWLDPVLAQKQVANIRDGLIAADSANASAYRANASAYIQKLQQLDQEFKTRLASAQGCQIIAFHDAYPYLAKRYGIQQMAVVELPEDSLSPQDIQRVSKAVQQSPVKALFSEPGISDSRIQQIASDVGVPVKILDPIEVGPLDPQYYFTAMRKNLNNLVEACQ
ncbi:MAG: metal ABC transporter solute-binding protein, Zn/Mn family [Microcoleaceae cyanobacterium]